MKVFSKNSKVTKVKSIWPPSLIYNRNFLVKYLKLCLKLFKENKVPPELL